MSHSSKPADRSRASALGTASTHPEGPRLPDESGETGFAFRLLHVLDDKNLVFSPASLWIALGMVLAGARGQTAESLARGLGVPGEPALWGPLFAEALRACQNGDRQTENSLRTANRLWAQQSIPIESSFLSILRQVFGSDLARLDFSADSEGCRRRINQWVEEQTASKIQDLLAEGMVTPDTLLVITNAVYFLGKWLSRFEASATKRLPFDCAPEQRIEVSMMYQASRLPYARTDGVQLVELPYLGGALSMVIVLPLQRNGLARIESGLTAARFSSWIEALDEQPVSLWLPRFKLDSPAVVLNDVLKKIGLGLLFDRPDLSGMTPQPLMVARVIHKAFVAVDEAGTEAAAATAVVMLRGGPPSRPAEMRADHPFLFFIRHRSSGVILFLGRVSQPEQPAAR